MLLGLLLAQLAVAAPAPQQPQALSAAEAMKQGLQHYREADFEGAIPLFQRADQAAPDADKKAKAQAQLWLGLAFFNIGSADLARQSFRAALLADPNVKLPDEAPPPLIPMFANVKGDLERSAPRQTEPPKRDVPDATADRAHAGDAEHAQLAPDLTREEAEVSQPSEPRGRLLPKWVPQALVGAGAGAVLVGGYFKLASNGSFTNAANASTAAESTRLAHHADSQQHLARTLALSGIASAAVGAAIYLLDDANE